MKTINQYISEALRIKTGANVISSTKVNNKSELVNELIKITKLGSGDFSHLQLSNIKNLDLLFTVNEIQENIVSNKITTLDFSGWDISNINSISEMFYGLTTIKEIKGLNTWNTSNVLSMYGTFHGCESIEELDLSGWKTNKCEVFSQMFLDCKQLKTIKGIESFKFKPDAEIELIEFFNNCNALTDCSFVQHWDLSNVQSLIFTFKNTGIKDLDLSKCNIKDELLDCTGICANCTHLETFNGLKDILKNARYLDSMFLNCESLKTIIDSPKKIDLQDLESAEKMFSGCSQLKLDASNWIISNESDLNEMFRGTNPELLLKPKNYTRYFK